MPASHDSLLRRLRLLVLIAVCMPMAAYSGAFEDFFNAARNDNVDEINSLLHRGLDPNLVEEERGETGLIIAVREGSVRVFNALLNARNIDLEVKARNGDNALMVAAYKGNRSAVELLLAKGAEVNRPNWTALHYAAAAGKNDIVQMLLDRGADVNASSPNKTTPLMMAAGEGHIMTVKLLLDRGAELAVKNELGLNALDFASRNGHKDIVDGLTYRLKRAGKL
ncbi:ankyrin repeat domain-containing protein [Janthinobacterium sp. 17J80-10]|uniref:ankyrin repeat domain-containing protein n=1 Tax=Janthinobacterium sp. 17J80-10 TaxID=2497863 RepID=UPI0010052CDB|nr:ankyrin repeat domain-containing protein [Janthinobacterium sp. 17J80-10]QAU34587.1 ankyrin repeat domain-containing protein [Janthinobacterium sp. 17J80-10]